MPPIAIITDTDASLPVELADRNGIQMVGILVNFGQQTFVSVSEMDDRKLFERIDREGKLPSTSAPSGGQFLEAYQRAFDQGAEEVICLTVSSELSAVYSSAKNAAEQLPGRAITVVDTRSVSIAQGFMVLEAAKAAGEGADREEILARVQSVGQRAYLYGALSTLKYLAMSGRVGYLAAGIGSLLNVRPILTLRNAKLDLLEKVRTRVKSWARVIELAQQAAAGRSLEKVAVFHANAIEDARQFEGQLRASLPCPEEILTVELTPGLSVHTGAGMVGVALVTAE